MNSSASNLLASATAWEFAKFAAEGTLGLGLNVVLLTGFVELLAIPPAYAVLCSGALVAITGYLVTNYWVYNQHASPTTPGGHLKRGLAWYAAMWSGKIWNYLLYLALLAIAIPYQAAWIIGAVAVVPWNFAVTRWLWSRHDQ